MGYMHHGTIKKYTSVLLDLFNDLEIQYMDSNNIQRSKNIPLKYSTVEKSKMLDEYSVKQIIQGNYNVLPVATLSLAGVQKAETRNTNKNLKINTVKNEDSFEFQYNSVSYEFLYDLRIRCRGMNEATMIIEQIAPKFNPTVNVDVYDGLNISEPTRVPIKLLDFGIESEPYEEFSANIITVSASISLMGNLYPPIKSISRIKDFKILLNEQNGNYYNRRVIMGWDVNDEGVPENPTIKQAINMVPDIIDILVDGIIKIGTNNLTVIYNDKDSFDYELKFEWFVVTGDANIIANNNKAELIINSGTEVEVEIKIIDYNNNYSTLNKIFTV